MRHFTCRPLHSFSLVCALFRWGVPKGVIRDHFTLFLNRIPHLHRRPRIHTSLALPKVYGQNEHLNKCG